MSTVPVFGSADHVPVKLGELDLIGVDHSPNPAHGVMFSYRHAAAAFKATTYIYDMGLSDIPDDLESPEVIGLFKHSMDAVRLSEQQGLIRDLKLVRSGLLKSFDRSESASYWHAEFRYLSAHEVWSTSHMALRIDRGYINKIRYSYPDPAANPDLPQDAADVFFYGFRLFCEQWIHSVQTAEPALESPPNQVDISFTDEAKTFARDAIREATAQPGGWMQTVLLMGGPYGFRALPAPIPQEGPQMYAMGFMLTATIGSVRASEVALAFHVPDNADGPSHSPHEVARLIHAWRDGGYALYSADLQRREGQPTVVGEWKLDQLSPVEKLSDWIGKSLHNGLKIAQNVDTEPSEADIRQELDRAFRLGPDAFNQVSIGFRDLLVESLMNEAFGNTATRKLGKMARSWKRK